MNKIATFFSEVKKEASKVTWPTRQETMMTSVMVVILSSVMGGFFLLVDAILAWASRGIINIRF